MQETVSNQYKLTSEDKKEKNATIVWDMTPLNPKRHSEAQSGAVSEGQRQWERERESWTYKKPSLSYRLDGVAAILQVTNEERGTREGEIALRGRQKRGAL